MLRITLPHVQLWNVWYNDTANSPAGLEPHLRLVDDVAREVGRDPREIERTVAERQRSFFRSQPQAPRLRKQTSNDVFIFFRLKAACAVNQYATGLNQPERGAGDGKLLVGHPAEIIRLQSPAIVLDGKITASGAGGGNTVGGAGGSIRIDTTTLSGGGQVQAVVEDVVAEMSPGIMEPVRRPRRRARTPR